MYKFVSFLDYLENTDESNHKYLRFFLPILDKLVVSIPFFWFFVIALNEKSPKTDKISADKSKNLDNQAVDKSSSQKLSKPSALSIFIDQSCTIFVAWSKLGFSLVAFQFMYVSYILATSRTPFSFTGMAMFRELYAAYIFIFLISNIVFVFFENPLHNLNNNYLGLTRRKKIEDAEEINNNLVTKKSN